MSDQTSTAIPVRPEPCASTDPTHAFDHEVITEAGQEIERLRALFGAVKDIATDPINEFETETNRLAMIQRLASSALGNGRSTDV